jgi:hypothetical protein
MACLEWVGLGKACFGPARSGRLVTFGRGEYSPVNVGRVTIGQASPSVLTNAYLSIIMIGRC